MNKNNTGAKSKTKIIFEKLTVEEEKKVLGSGNPDKLCQISPPGLSDC